MRLETTYDISNRQIAHDEQAKRGATKTVFVALGIYDRLGGLERFNQRVVRCLTHFAHERRIDPARVLSLWDAPRPAESVGGALLFDGFNHSKVRMAARFAWTFLRHRPDVLLVGHVLLWPLAVVAALLSPRTRIVLFVHGTDVWGKRGRGPVSWMERWAVQHFMHRIVSVSRYTAKVMADVYGLESDRFAILPNATDIRPDGMAPPAGPLRPPRRLITVTRLSAKDMYKGCNKVILAVDRLRHEFPDLEYWIVGDGPLRAELAAMTERLGLARHVHLLGRLSDSALHDRYSEADIFVMPSTGEGFGIVFLEAWQHGLPVVCGNADASPEVVQHEVSGLTVDPHSVEDLIAALRRLIDGPALAQRLGRNGFQAVMERYTHAHFQKRLWQIVSAR